MALRRVLFLRVDYCKAPFSQSDVDVEEFGRRVEAVHVGYLFFPNCLPSLKRMNETNCASWCDEEVVMVGGGYAAVQRGRGYGVPMLGCGGADAMKHRMCD